MHAVKFILLDTMSEKRLKEAGREIRNQWRCDHNHVAGIKWVNLVRHTTRYHPREQTFLAIAMEYCAGGELFYSIAQGKFASEGEKRMIFAQLVSAVEYLHSHLEICHRDLKLENVLLDANNQVKVCDFGVSKSSGFDSDPRSCVGTPAYCAPEVLHGAGRHQYDGSLADVWSLGVVLYILEYRQFPFGAEPEYSLVKVMTNIRTMSFVGPVPNRPEGVDDLIRYILTRDPSRRLPLSRIWDHPWMQPVAAAARAAGPNATGGPIQQVPEVEAVFAEAERLVLQTQQAEQLQESVMDEAFQEDQLDLDDADLID